MNSDTSQRRNLQQRRPFLRRKGLRLALRGLKFNFVGWLGMLVNSGVLYLLKGVLEVPLIPASIVAIELAIIHNFIWHRKWTWKSRNGANPPPFFRQLLLYNAMTGLVDLVVNVTILWVLATFFGVHFMLANIAGMALGPIFKFWLNEKVIFKRRRRVAVRNTMQAPHET